MRVLLMLFVGLCFVSCATKPPVQTMAEARAAVQSVRVLYSDEAAKEQASYRFYQSAERALMEATEALSAKKYVLAKQKANQAKRQARLAAKRKE